MTYDSTNIMNEDIVLFDFESGTYEGWTIEGGEAFGSTPVEPGEKLWSLLSSWQRHYEF